MLLEVIKCYPGSNERVVYYFNCIGLELSSLFLEPKFTVSVKLVEATQYALAHRMQIYTLTDM